MTHETGSNTTAAATMPTCEHCDLCAHIAQLVSRINALAFGIEREAQQGKTLGDAVIQHAATLTGELAAQIEDIATNAECIEARYAITTAAAKVVAVSVAALADWRVTDGAPAAELKTITGMFVLNLNAAATEITNLCDVWA